VLLMVMIDSSHEKKSLGVISVTCVTKTLLIKLLDACRIHDLKECLQLNVGDYEGVSRTT